MEDNRHFLNWADWETGWFHLTFCLSFLLPFSLFNLPCASSCVSFFFKRCITFYIPFVSFYDPTLQTLACLVSNMRITGWVTVFWPRFFFFSTFFFFPLHLFRSIFSLLRASCECTTQNCRRRRRRIAQNAYYWPELDFPSFRSGSNCR